MFSKSIKVSFRKLLLAFFQSKTRRPAMPSNIHRGNITRRSSSGWEIDVFKSVKWVFGWVYLHSYLLFCKLQALIGVNVGIKQSWIYSHLPLSLLCDIAGWLKIILSLLFRYQRAKQNLAFFLCNSQFRETCLNLWWKFGRLKQMMFYSAAQTIWTSGIFIGRDQGSN